MPDCFYDIAETILLFSRPFNFCSRIHHLNPKRSGNQENLTALFIQKHKFACGIFRIFLPCTPLFHALLENICRSRSFNVYIIIVRFNLARGGLNNNYDVCFHLLLCKRIYLFRTPAPTRVCSFGWVVLIQND